MSEITLQRLITRLERLLQEPGPNEHILRQALSKAAEATRSYGRRKQDLIDQAQELLRQALEGGAS